MPAKRVVLAEYYALEELTLLFIVRHDFNEPRVEKIPVPLAEIRQIVADSFGGTEMRTKVHELRLPQWREWQNRFRPFVEPILSCADEKDLIWFVPHDVLHYLPLHSLAVEGGVLIDRNPVCYTPSASVMKYCHAMRQERAGRERGRALIFADSRADLPLPHAREQALALQQLFDPDAELYVDGEATKTLVRQRLAESREEISLLHFACHGYFHPSEALRSGVMLAPENDTGRGPTQIVAPAPEDSPWNLTAEEILGLDMRADLVTLSACESGVNQRRPGDELIGLTRAFIHAGTPSVVVSLWSVEEISTSILMQTFYEHLRGGVSKAEALQQAQLHVKQLKVREAIALCQQARARATSDDSRRIVLDEDIARLRYQAGDLHGARADYQSLQGRFPPSSPKFREYARRIIQCELAATADGQPDYDRAIYESPYYWSPFVLVGDWK
jgi:CHAT domain-containing protein